MKYNFYLLAYLLCACPILSSAQNWAPLNPSEKWNFQADTSNLINTVIFADSVTLNGTDSVYHLNRVVEWCDTCALFVVNTMLENQPQFMQRTAIRKAGGIWNFSDPGNIALHTWAPQGFSWTLDTLSGMTATVDTITVETVFGTPDSVKHIYLQPGDTLLLSKNHGMLKWHDWSGTGVNHTLVGIKGRDLGELLPGFDGFFDFQPGDVWQVRKRESFWDLQNYETEWLTKVTIDTVIESANSKHVLAWQVRTTTAFTGGIPMVVYYANQAFEFWVNDSTRHFANHYPDQLVNCTRNMIDYLPDTTHQPGSMVMDQSNTNRYYQRARYYRNAEGKICIGYTNVDPGWGTYYERSQQYPGILVQFPDGGDSLQLTEGLGITQYNYMYFETSGFWKMEGYVHNGDTVGIVLPDSVILSQQAAAGPQVKVHVYPNPASDRVHVSGEWQGNAELFLFDAGGRLIRRMLVEGNEMTMETGSLPSGVYLLELVTGEGVAREKLVVGAAK